MNESQTCSNPDCQIAENGSCLQGHDPVESCPNFGKSLEAETVTVVEQNETEPATEKHPSTPKLQLSSGQSLTQGEVDDCQLRRAGRLIAIVGDTSSGKSTLLCSIYDRFLRGPFAERSYVASLTLSAFEQLAHLSRAASGALTPNTRRTYMSEGLKYYHLSSAPQSEPGKRFDLFMSDRAGETYRSGMDRPEEFNALPELKLARVIVVLIDGARLSQAAEIHEVLDSARRIVRTMIDGGALDSTQHLQLVLTKRDEVERSGNAADIIERLNAVAQRLEFDYGSQLASITFFETAARDSKSTFAPAHGCDALFASWTSVAEPGVQAVTQSETNTTPFDRLALNQEYGESA